MVGQLLRKGGGTDGKGGKEDCCMRAVTKGAGQQHDGTHAQEGDEGESAGQRGREEVVTELREGTWIARLDGGEKSKQGHRCGKVEREDTTRKKSVHKTHGGGRADTHKHRTGTVL